MMQYKVSWDYSQAKLDMATSDQSATYLPGENGDEDASIILIGGCDSPKGNQGTHADRDFFECTSISSATYEFDPFGESVRKLAYAPHARARHAAVELGGEIWVLGGRDGGDALVSAVDVYDPSKDKWRTVGYLPEDVTKSDITGFVHEEYIYVVGGFDATYTAHGSTYRIDTTAFASDVDSSDEIPVSAIDEMASLNEARGDIQAAVLDGYAYVAGGITHENQWCHPLASSERYHIATDTWQTMDDLMVGRADAAMGAIHGKVFIIGGETKPSDCDPDPAFASIPVSDLEVFQHADDAHNTNDWTVMEEFPADMFRFSAVAVPALDSIFTFGGQKPYNTECDCYETSDAIVFHKSTMVDVHVDSAAPAVASSAVMGVSVFGALLGFWFLLA